MHISNRDTSRSLCISIAEHHRAGTHVTERRASFIAPACTRQKRRALFSAQARAVASVAVFHSRSIITLRKWRAIFSALAHTLAVVRKNRLRLAEWRQRAKYAQARIVAVANPKHRCISMHDGSGCAQCLQRLRLIIRLAFVMIVAVSILRSNSHTRGNVHCSSPRAHACAEAVCSIIHFCPLWWRLAELTAAKA